MGRVAMRVPIALFLALLTSDHHLDVVFPPDLGEARWKDEHELEEAVW